MEQAMRLIDVKKDGIEAARTALIRTNLQDNPAVEKIVRDIIADVRTRRDEALIELSRRFDSPAINAVEVDRQTWDEAGSQVPEELKQAIELAAANVRRFHEPQRRSSWMDSQEGKTLGQLIRPLEKVGVYVPGGTAVYFSSVIMAALPASVAGVDEIVLTTPARKDGTVHPALLYAAKLAGVSRVFTVGGAQAIAAMAFGTQSIPRVDKIVGPGNAYVNVAKKLLWGVTDMDMLAGPSEVCVVADEEANPLFAAMDLLTQAEHDVEAAAFLITTSANVANAVLAEIEKQLAILPRAEILRKALDNNSAIVIAESLDQAIELANVCAPEHLALMIRDPFESLSKIRSAGAVLLGGYTPQTLGDYLAGPSHTLPTSGTARFSSPLNVDTFLKKTNFLSYQSEALEPVISHLEVMARAEGFEAHAAAASARRKSQDG